MAELEANRIDAELAPNQLAPEARAFVEVSRDLGDESRNETLVGTNFAFGAKIKVPILFRKARGASNAADAKVAETEAKVQWLDDQLSLLVRDLASRVRAATERARVSRDLVIATQPTSLSCSCVEETGGFAFTVDFS